MCCFETEKKDNIVEMEAFFRTHHYLIKHVQSPVKRVLMDEIDWSDRLIGIKGSRGVGKTTFLLQYAKEHFGEHDRTCLYINFNNFYFTEHTLTEFAEGFYAEGGRVLLVDQVFKNENWSRELRECYDRFPELRIIFSASSVMRLIEENDDLKDVVRFYNLRGFSFREYLNLQSGCHFPTYKLEEIIEHHQTISQEICSKVKPLWYFADYLHHGYYPFFLENRNYSENLLKTMNMMLEVDVLLIKQIELKYLSKIRRLLHILMNSAPCALNVSQLSTDIETSRATIMNYIKYLQDSRLLNLLYTKGSAFPKKPNKVYLQNTNLMYAISTRTADEQNVAETFFYNALHAKHKVNAGIQGGSFIIDGQQAFTVYSDALRIKRSHHTLKTVANLEIGTSEQIPLWLLGFLY